MALLHAARDLHRARAVGSSGTRAHECYRPAGRA